jgi:hypothetical protein
VVLHRRELPLLSLGLLVSQVAAVLQFAAYTLNGGVTKAEDLGDDAPDDLPVIRLGEQPPQHTPRVGGEAWVIRTLVGQGREMAEVSGPVDCRPGVVRE